MTESSKKITWQDPSEGAAKALTMSGLDYLRAMANGEVPMAPISALMNMTALRAEPGEMFMEAQPDTSQYNPIGSVHGGFYATLLDSVCGCAIQTTLPLGQAYTSLEIKVSFLRQINADTGTVYAHGWVTKPGSKAAFAEGDLRDGAGKLLATASSACLVFPIG
ncbi:MAG: PaaI family thioesterase [Humibacillus sp.]|nr:PaaI family thioesterase [Humibacillus sp.]MDN5776138.1 PaaI family thioesterase [Humibacillus sp.]